MGRVWLRKPCSAAESACSRIAGMLAGFFPPCPCRSFAWVEKQSEAQNGSDLVLADQTVPETSSRTPAFVSCSCFPAIHRGRASTRVSLHLPNMYFSWRDFSQWTWMTFFRRPDHAAQGLHLGPRRCGARGTAQPPRCTYVASCVPHRPLSLALAALAALATGRRGPTGATAHFGGPWRAERAPPERCRAPSRAGERSRVAFYGLFILPPARRGPPRSVVVPLERESVAARRRGKGASAARATRRLSPRRCR